MLTDGRGGAHGIIAPGGAGDRAFARPPRRFRVVDVMTRRVLGEGDARATVEVLEPLHSIVDVSIYVWQPAAEDWRLLTHGEKQLVWGARGR